MDTEKVVDWKGNEVKAGMIIYFVQTKPMTLGKLGMFMLGGNTEIWESDEDYEKRKSEDIWFLGQPYIVELQEDGKLVYTTKPDEDGYTFSQYFYNTVIDNSTIAIKGISDTK